MNWRARFMATKRWLVNASPLILLGKSEHLALLSLLADVVLVPQAVAHEIGAKPDGRPILQAIERNPSYRVVSDETVSSEVLSWDLGAGETQVIASAQALGADRVVIDDMAARRCARVMGLRVIGTLGIIGRAKSEGLIKLAGPIIERLREAGLYISDDLVQRLLREVGE